MIQDKLKILANDKVAPEYYKMALKSPEIVSQAKPGQFVHIKVNDSFTPLLRRPFSICFIKDNTFEILYRVVGKGTALLSEKKVGEEVDVIGPLGNGFKISKTDAEIVIIGGGAGIAPLLFLTQKLVEFSNNIMVLIGGKTKELILCQREFRDLRVDVQVSTEDGSDGYKGLVTDLLWNQRLSAELLCACGPFIMIQEVARFSLENKLPCQVSLESTIACGVGACLGCVINIRDGEKTIYKRVCKDGPVFDANEVIW